MAEKFRIEKDSLGDVKVPLKAKWAAQTQRAVENFPISGLTIDPAMVAALAAIKGSIAMEKVKLKMIKAPIAKAISAAADQIIDGAYGDQFPVDVYQTGSGTSSNMNINEVLATLASEALGEKVHPNDHVNDPFSSNDVFPSAIHVAATDGLVNDLIPSLEHLAKSLRKKAKAFDKVVKSGRTHLMDATPVTLGQEFSGYAASIEYGVERIKASLPRVGELPLGGTAVGTGLNCPPGFAGRRHRPHRQAVQGAATHRSP